MRYVELRRPTDNDGDRLTPQAVADAETIGRRSWTRCRRAAGRSLSGHSPTNEAAVLGLVGAVVSPLGKGAGVLLTEDGGTYRLEPLH